MKKFLAMLMILALCFGAVGASCLNDVKPSVDTAQDRICNAPPEVVSVAEPVIALLKPLVGSLVPGSAAFTAFVTAQGIKDTGCAAVTALNTMITYLEGVNTERALAYQGKKAAPLGLDVGALKKWRDGK